MVADELISQFKTELRGELLQPSDQGYDNARSIWNGMIDRKPDMIARCIGTSDVISCVNFARDNNVPFTIKGGGHNISGLAVRDGGLMIDMSGMRGVWVDAENKVARAQAGCTLGDVDNETQLYGLAAVLGFVSETGIAGLTLGGGFGYLTRRYGWTSDNLISVEMVTAEGNLIRASKSENPDLFWALCGGGGNFGVVTGFEYMLYPVGPQITAGAIAWPAERSQEVLSMLKDVMSTAPRELACVAGLRIAPPAPWLSKDIHGKPIVALFICHTGSLEDAEKLLEPIKSFAEPVGDIVQPRSYVSQQSLLDATQPKGRRYYWKSEYLPELSDGLFSKAMDNASKIISPHSAILLFPLQGALNEIPEDDSAVGNRKSEWVINIASAWDDSNDDQKNIKWARDTWEDIREFSTGGTYINFLNEEEGADRIKDAYGENYGRLAEVKGKWDPTNLFNANKNIMPSS